MEFSKKMLILFTAVSILLCGATVAGTLLRFDVSAIAILAGTSLVSNGTWGGFYLWKAKNENRAKYAQKFIDKFATKHGVDAAIRVAEVVLKD